MKQIYYQNKDITPPYNLNLLLGIFAPVIYLILLLLVENSQILWHKIIFIVLFAHIANTIFSLLHETVHNVFHYHKKTNYIFGNLFAAFFPTAFSFQKRCHLNHHRNNRTHFESFELYNENDSYLVRAGIFYAVLTGFYYFIPFIGCIWLLISPKSMLNSKFSGKDNFQIGRAGGASMLRSFENLSIKEITRMRYEVLFTIFLQISIIYFLNLSLLTILLCYLSFGIMWSTLQYVDHAYSAKDIRNGAWNIKVNPITRSFFLNYHYHQAHHQHPNVSWYHLKKFIDPKYDYPSFWKIYLRMWKGLEKDDLKSPEPIDQELERLIENEHFSS